MVVAAAAAVAMDRPLHRSVEDHQSPLHHHYHNSSSNYYYYYYPDHHYRLPDPQRTAKSKKKKKVNLIKKKIAHQLTSSNPSKSYSISSSPTLSSADITSMKTC